MLWFTNAFMYQNTGYSGCILYQKKFFGGWGGGGGGGNKSGLH